MIMAVILKEEKEIPGSTKKHIVKVYKTPPGKLVTLEEKRKAEELDSYLDKKIKDIEKEMNSKGLLKLKGKKGEVIKLWYEVGKRLNFVTDTSIVSAEDREFVWRAIYDHAEKLAPGPISQRAKRDPESSHFSYCYKLSRFPWKFVEMAGDWTSWSEFFDRRETKNDTRIIEWLGKKAMENKVSGRQNWLRPLTKIIHKNFEKKDTTVFPSEELFQILDKIFLDLKENDSVQE